MTDIDDDMCECETGADVMEDLGMNADGVGMRRCRLCDAEVFYFAEDQS